MVTTLVLELRFLVDVILSFQTIQKVAVLLSIVSNDREDSVKCVLGATIL